MLHAELAVMPAERFQIVVYGNTDWKFRQKNAMRFQFWRMIVWILTLGICYKREVITFKGVEVAPTDPGFTNIWMNGAEADIFLLSERHHISSQTWTGELMPPNARIYFITVNVRDLKRLPRVAA